MFEYFDSFGLYPLDLNIYKFIKNKYFLASSKILQNLFSSACGQYCIFFIINRANRFSYDQILSLFNDNTLENDTHVMEYVTKFKPAINHESSNQCGHCSLKMSDCIQKFQLRLT